MGGKSFGRYELLELLGRGGMGEVYRAHDTATERIVAVKLLPADLAEDVAFQRRFRREARTAAGLNDPHVVPIHNYGEIDGRLYVDMRLIEGHDLGTLIASEGGRLSTTRAVAIIEQVATALDSAHHAGLVHRDVKPSNILITERDFAYLIDFGIARATADTAITGTGHMVGTLAYMAPERFNGTTDPRSDVYSLACVLHECLTGNRPYPGDSFEQQIAGHLTAPPPQPSTSSPGIPSAFDAVIARGLAKNPDERYQTASEFANAAQAALTSPLGTPAQPAWSARDAFANMAASTPIPPPSWPPSNPQRSRAPEQELQRRIEDARRRRFLTITGGAVAAVVVIIATVLAVTMTNPDHATKTAETTTSSAPEFTSGPAKTTATTAMPQTGSVPPLPAFAPSASVGANCQYPPSQDPATKPIKPPHTGKVPTDPATVSASMATNQGNIGLLLANNESPCTVNNFASLSSQGFFNGTQCHRLTTNPALRVLQCGDPKGDGTGGPGYGFANEYPTDQYPPDDPQLKQPVLYPRGTLAMANAGPGTNGSQFFLVYQDSQLPPAYTVFGTIQADGLATLDKIAQGGIAGGGQDGPPAIQVTINSVVLD